MENVPEQVPHSILVVDDDDGVRKVLSRWVAEMGYTVLSAGDADTALEIVQGHPVDVALCDIRMPGHDGIWLIDRIGRLYLDIAIVVATGLTEMDPMVTLRPGVVGYIVKPFNREQLGEMIRRGLTERARLKQQCHRGSRILPPGKMDDLLATE